MKNKVLIAAGVVLVLMLIGLTVLLISEKKTNKELVLEFNLDKEDLENQYTDFAKQYEADRLQRFFIHAFGAGTAEDAASAGRVAHREDQQRQRNTPSEERTDLLA
jgi:hypothetical protein